MPPRWVTEDVISRLRERLGLTDEQLSPSDIPFLPVVLATTDVDRVRRVVSAVIGSTGSLVAGTSGWTTLYTVPAGKRFYPEVMFIFRNSGDNTYQDPSRFDGSDNVIFYQTAGGQTSLQIPQNYHPSSFNAGDEIRINMGGAGTSATEIMARMLGVLEDA